MERPINFTTEMIEKILDGTKSQTRRPCKDVPAEAYDVEYIHEAGEQRYICKRENRIGQTLLWAMKIRTRYEVGDLLWVKEGWQQVFSEDGEGYAYIYKASQNGLDWEENTEDFRWKSPVTMPKEAARIWLEVEDRWIEKLQEISEGDATAEGCPCGEYNNHQPTLSAKGNYIKVWEDIYNEKHKPEFMWEKNCFVEAYKFRRVDNG